MVAWGSFLIGFGLGFMTLVIMGLIFWKQELKREKLAEGLIKKEQLNEDAKIKPEVIFPGETINGQKTSS